MNEKSVWDKAGAFLTGLIARWTFKVLSGFLLGIGVNQDKWEIWVTATISFLLGALISKSQNNYLRIRNNK